MAIMQCSCHNEFQDRLYGHGRRVHNMKKEVPKGVSQPYRCTSCGRENTKSGVKEKK